MLTNKQAIEYIDSILSNYDNPKQVDKNDPDYRLCEVWLSRYDIEAFEMAKDALRKLDTIKSEVNYWKNLDVPYSFSSMERIKRTIGDD